MSRYVKVALIVGAILTIGFLLMPESEEDKTLEKAVKAASLSERMEYFASHGWEVEELYSQQIEVPQKFDTAYDEYVQMQDKQGLPLRKYAGKAATLYVYEVKNYSPDDKKMLAELLVSDNIAIASMVYCEDCGSLRLSVS